MYHSKLDLYVLCDYQFTLTSIKKLIMDGFTWGDFENYTEMVKELNVRKPSLVSKIINTLPLVDEKKRKDNIYQLAHEGLSIGNINKLIEQGLDYQDLSFLTFEHFSSLLGGKRKSLFIKIREAYKNIEILKGKTDLFAVEECMREVVYSLQPRQVLTYQFLKEQVEFKLQINNINMVLVENFVEKNVSNGLLIKTENGFVKKYKRVEEYLAEDFINKDVLLMRMKGMSLKEIGDMTGVSRQAVSNKEKRILYRLDGLEELLIYKELFERFDWSQELFCELYHEAEEVYQLLNLKFQKGGENPLILLNEDNGLNEQQKEAILKNCEVFVAFTEEVKPLNKNTIFEEVIFHKCKEHTNDEEVAEKFNKYIVTKGLDLKFLVDSTAVRGMSERSSIIIRTRSNQYRYYDYEDIDQTIKKRLLEILDLEPGIYNMIKIFTENKDLMQEIDIRSEHELHNLYKRTIVKDGVSFNRMPEFSVGNMNKNEFLIKLFNEQAPIHVDDFTLYVEENFGLRVNSLRSHIQMFLVEYLHGDIIKVDYHELEEEELLKINNLLQEDIYTVEQLNKIGKKIDPEFHDKFLNNMILSKVGYSLKGKYVIKNMYPKVERYFKNHILSHDYFSRNGLELYNTSVFNSSLYALEKNLDVVKIEKDMYITSKMLEEAKVNKSKLINYRDEALSMVDDNQYFTLYSLRQSDFTHEIEDLGFEDNFYERIIWTSDKVRTIHLADGSIYIKNETDVSLIDFIKYLVEREGSMNIYDMYDHVKDYYGISIDLPRVLSLVKQTEVYYSEDLSKLFIDKNTYFEEIYEHGY